MSGRLLVVVTVVAGVLAATLALLTRPVGRPPAARVSVAEALTGDDSGYARATAPRPFTFPADHGPHARYRTEWWYYTGNLETPEGRHFGYQLTFFRIALAAEGLARESAWGTREVYMAHFAVTDTAGRRFHPRARFARGAAGLAGAASHPFRVWTEDWSATSAGPDALPMRLQASEHGIAIDLALESTRAPVAQGERGLSRKGPEPGNASYYYSFTRMPTRGTVQVGEERFEVRGLSWMDREWSTSALGDKVGWDWFALQLDDGRDVMYYQLRRADGSTDRFSAGTVVGPDGRTRTLAADDVTLEVLDVWTSLRGVRYPGRWRLAIPAEGLDVEIVPRLADQEHIQPFRYWEGAVLVRAKGTPARGGVGYVELVGYGEPARERVASGR
jgi:predicted secreted hydrolase